jgi:hypothetical protein
MVMSHVNRDAFPMVIAQSNIIQCLKSFRVS